MGRPWWKAARGESLRRAWGDKNNESSAESELRAPHLQVSSSPSPCARPLCLCFFAARLRILQSVAAFIAAVLVSYCAWMLFFLLGPTCFCSTGSLRYRPSTISFPVPRAPLPGSSGPTWHRAHRWSANPAIVSISACLTRVLDSLSRVSTVPPTPRDSPDALRTRYLANQSTLSRATFAPPVYSRWRPAPPARSPLSLRLSKPGRAMTSLL